MTSKEITEAVRRYHERQATRMDQRTSELELAIIRYRARRSARIALKNLESLKNTDGKSLDTEFSSDKIQLPIKSDGGPGSGNFGHKGVPGQVGGSASGGGSQYSQKDYEKALIGKKTVDGKTVKSITAHAVSRYKGRQVYPSSIASSLKNAKPRPGKTPGRTVYEHRGTRVVLDDKDGAIVTVIYTGKGKK